MNNWQHWCLVLPVMVPIGAPMLECPDASALYLCHLGIPMCLYNTMCASTTEIWNGRRGCRKQWGCQYVCTLIPIHASVQADYNSTGIIQWTLCSVYQLHVDSENFGIQKCGCCWAQAVWVNISLSMPCQDQYFEEVLLFSCDLLAKTWGTVVW